MTIDREMNDDLNIEYASTITDVSANLTTSEICVEPDIVCDGPDEGGTV